MKLMIDTDVGIDDAVALLMILAHPDTEITAITTVVGNIPLAQATLNAGVVLDVADAPAIPIYQGCARPLLQNEPLHAMDFHGTDGLGGAGRTETSRPVEAEHAALALLRLARQHSGQLTLLTLGPLTNIALAQRIDPNFLKHFRRIVMMAGSVDARGNTSPPAEFNVAVDPEAAKIVLDACRDIAERVWLVSWEASLDHATPLTEWREMIRDSSAIAQFTQAMTRHVEKWVAGSSQQAIPWADPLAAAVALDPTIVSGYETRFVDVEVGDNLARGQTIVDYRRRGAPPPNLNIVRHIEPNKFRDLLGLVVQ